MNMLNDVEEGAEQLAAAKNVNEQEVQRKHQFLKSLINSAAIAMSALLLCTIGLRGSVSVLSVGVTNLFRSNQSHNINKIVATVNPTFVKEYIKLEGGRVLSNTINYDFDYHEKHRYLKKYQHVATLNGNAEDARHSWEKYTTNKTPLFEVTVVDLKGRTYTGYAAQGAQYHPRSSNGKGSGKRECDVYDNITEVDNPGTTYKVKCCGDKHCKVYMSDDHSKEKRGKSKKSKGRKSGKSYDKRKNIFENDRTRRRILGYKDMDQRHLALPLIKLPCDDDSDCEIAFGNSDYYCDTSTGAGACAMDDCFSPLSTVVEKKKGKMLLKDLQFGDHVQAASNGKYQPYVLSPHSSTSKLTSFVQIHTDSSENPLEVTPGHMVFLHGKDLPVQANKVKIGDSMIGVDGLKTVSKIDMVKRDGFYNVLTNDATLFVDGLLTSSMTELNKEGKKHISFGPFQIHAHAFVSWLTPLLHIGCNKIDSFYCETQVNDGSGGTLNLVISCGRFILELPQVLQAIIFPSLATMAAACILAYYLTLLLFVGIAGTSIHILILKMKNMKVKLV